MSEVQTVIAEARRAALEHRFEDAAQFASEALHQLPNCLVALRILAWTQLERDDEAALASFQQCAEFDPEDALAHVGQAIWYQRHGDNAAAKREWLQAWELDPHNQPIRRALVKLTRELPESAFAEATSLLRSGRVEDARDALKRVRADRKDPAVDVSLMVASWSVGAHHDAFDLAVKVLTHNPRSIKAALYLAALEDRAGRTLRSREAIARAEQIDPGLSLYADVVREVGLQPALEQHRAVANARAR